MNFSHRRAAGLVAFTLALATLPAATWAQPASPATRPLARATTRPATAEQREFARKVASEPADQPSPKMTLIARDGSVTDNFGKPERGFLQKHESFLERAKEPADVVFLGDSITEGWFRKPENRAIWDKAFGKYHPANFGIGGDKTQHVLWRIENGELDHVKPKVVVIMIGTNNSPYKAEEIAAGTTAVVKATRAKLPEAKILLLSIFPRNEDPNSEARKKIIEVNEILKKLDDGKTVKYFELWDQFLTPPSHDGRLTKEVMPDALHPNDKGYQIWADAMSPVLDEMMQ